MKILITKSNTTLFRPGDITEVSFHPDGSTTVWSERQQKVENLNWLVKVNNLHYTVLVG